MQAAVEDAQAAFAQVTQAQARVTSARADAEANRIRQRGYRDCLARADRRAEGDPGQRDDLRPRRRVRDHAGRNEMRVVEAAVVVATVLGSGAFARALWTRRRTVPRWTAYHRLEDGCRRAYVRRDAEFEPVGGVSAEDPAYEETYAPDG